MSQIHLWQTDPLVEAASEWSTTAETWDDAFAAIVREAACPGGVPWEGVAAEAAMLRAGQDRVTVGGAADCLRVAASVARYGADEIHGARQLALEAVHRAEANGFVVGEDLSVRDRHMHGPPAMRAIRHAQAQALAATIETRAAQLAAIDEGVAARISSAVAGLKNASFHQTPLVPPRRTPRFEPVDRTFRLQPVPDPSPGGGPVPNAQNIQDAIGGLPAGTKCGIRLVRDPAQLQRLLDWVKRNSTEYTSGTPYRGGQGIELRLPDGTIVRMGPSTEHGPTVDITIPDAQIQLPGGGTIKLHVDAHGGDIQFPPGLIAESPRPPAPELPVLELPPPPPPSLAPVAEPIPGGGPPLGRMDEGGLPRFGIPLGPFGGHMLPDPSNRPPVF